MNKYNSEGYIDPTAYGALSAIEQEEKETEAKIKKMMDVFKWIAKLNGFTIESRIVFKDKSTGRKYR